MSKAKHKIVELTQLQRWRHIALKFSEREAARLAGSMKKRGSKAKALDAWIKQQDLSRSNDDLWNAIPTDEREDVYRKDDLIRERESGRAISRASFNQRLTRARKNTL